MAQSSLLVQTPEAPRRGILWAVAAGISALLILYTLNGG